MKNMTSIDIIQGYEYRVLVEDIFDQNKFFYPVYKKSIDIIEEICQNSKKNSEAPSETEVGMYPNNIVMFCADRGCGKSSAMISVSDALRNLQTANKDKVNLYSKTLKEIHDNCLFSVLKAIDPTTIGENEHFMRVVLSRMFANFRSNLEEEKPKAGLYDVYEENREKKNKLFLEFKKCYRLLDVICQRGDNITNNDDLDDLADLGDSSNLRSEFKKLTNTYLEYFFPDKEIKKFMVIQLDDADLNAKMAYNIIEDIRKYCVIPNVIILMAVNMDQMHQVIDQHFFAEFKGILDVEKQMETYEDQVQKCREMSVRYIDKILPPGHQIHLPKIEDFIINNSSDLTVKYICEREKKDMLDFRFYRKKTNANVTDFQERLLRLIYNKTSIVLIKPQDGVHEFLPRTMRELTHFLNYMCNLPDFNNPVHLTSDRYDERQEAIYGAELENSKIILNNIRALEQFFLQNWCDTNLKKHYCSILNKVANVNSNQKVYTAINLCEKKLNCRFLPKRYSLAVLQQQLEYISKREARYEEADKLSGVNKFIFAMRFYFTLFLNGLFCRCVESNHDFYRIYEAVGFEIWEPDYSKFTRYPLNGRFPVDYSALIKYIPELSDINVDSAPIDIKNLLKNCCTINIRGNRQLMNLDSSDVLNAIEELKSNTNTDITVMFDFVMLLFFNPHNNITIDVDKNNNLAISSNILLTLNLEVQHYIEKNINVRRSDSPNYIDWCSDFLSKVNNSLSRIDYFPINWNVKAIDIGYLPLSNRQLAIEIAKYNIEQLCEKVKNVNFPGSKDNFESFITNFSKNIVKFVGDWNKNMSELSKMSKISNKIVNLNNLWSDINEAPTLYEQFSKMFNSNDNNEKEISERIAEFQSKFDEWKSQITDDRLLSEVISDIEKSFGYSSDKKQSESSKQNDISASSQRDAEKKSRTSAANRGKTSETKANDTSATEEKTTENKPRASTARNRKTSETKVNDTSATEEKTTENKPRASAARKSKTSETKVDDTSATKEKTTENKPRASAARKSKTSEAKANDTSAAAGKGKTSKTKKQSSEK